MKPIRLVNKENKMITLFAVTETFVGKTSDTLYHIIDSDGRIRKVLFDSIAMYTEVKEQPYIPE